jgi:HAD superfamily hydrolase (TIGR01509 family)
MSHKIQAILFDMDGVLVDSEPVILAAAIAGLAEYGVHAKPEDFTPFIGTGEDRFIGGVAEKYGLVYQTEMKIRVYQIYQEIVPLKLKVYDGVVDLLTNLQRQGIKMALASSADLVKINANLKVAKIPKDFFNAIVSGEDVVQKKPAPEIYLKAAQKIGIQAANCIVVEDALNGITAAKAAGMRCIAVTTSFDRATLQKEKPDFICRQIGEVAAVTIRL